MIVKKTERTQDSEYKIVLMPDTESLNTYTNSANYFPGNSYKNYQDIAG
jgi:hypothetical protein